MKRILSFLLCIIFLKAQAFAIHGNLEGADSGTILTGTYSGTMVPVDADQGTRVFDFSTGEQTGTINSIGIFTMAMPASGIGQGSFLVFTEGRSFSGTIIGVGNPASGTLNGILEATFEYIDFLRDDAGNIIIDATGVPQSQTYQAAVRGSLTAQIESGIANINALNAASGNFGRLTGTAETGSMFVGPNGAGELVSNGIVRYTVDGVKQSLTADASAVLQSAASDAEDTTTDLSLLELLLL
jgi:hypothetical protein